MIDYTAISKNIQKKRYEDKQKVQDDLYTCYYDPHRIHDLCPHPTKCIFDADLYETRKKIGILQASLIEEKEFLKTAMEYKNEHKDKKYEELFYNYNPIKSKKNIKKLKNELIKLHKHEDSIITKPGGFD